MLKLKIKPFSDMFGISLGDRDPGSDEPWPFSLKLVAMAPSKIQSGKPSSAAARSTIQSE
jgi:hypothetical protein